MAALGDAKTLAAAAQQGDQPWLRVVDLFDHGQGSDVVESLIGRTSVSHLAALRERHDPKGGAGMVAFAHHVEVAHLEGMTG